MYNNVTMYMKVTSNKTGERLRPVLLWVWIANKKGIVMVEPDVYTRTPPPT